MYTRTVEYPEIEEQILELAQTLRNRAATTRSQWIANHARTLEEIAVQLRKIRMRDGCPVAPSS